MMKLASSLVVLALAIPLAAQSGSSLATNYDAATGDLTQSLTGAPADSFTFMVIGKTVGSSTIGNNLFTIDFDRPFFRMPFGRTDANGDLSRTVTVNSPRLAGETVYFQAVTVDLSQVSRPNPRRPNTGRPSTGRPNRRHGPRQRRAILRYIRNQATYAVSNQTSVTF